MAKIRDLADIVASHGRGTDSLLAHINPREAMMLKARGGSGVRNPKTGILEFDDGDWGDSGGGGAGGADAGGGGSGSTGSFGGDAGAESADYADATDASAAEMAGASGGNTSSFIGPQNELSSMGEEPNSSFESNFENTNYAPQAEPSILDKFTKSLLGMIPGKAIGAVTNALGIPGMVVGPATAIAKGQNPAGATVEGLANFATSGLFGLAKAAGSALGMSPDANQSGNTGGSTGQGGAGMDLNGLLQGLGGLYMGHRATGQYNGALDTLNNLYSPNSPYAQNMRQAMERRDAAAGRRSQYGTRETELAGNLAQAQGQALSSPGYANLMNQRGISQNQGLNTLLTLLEKSGMGKQGLQGLFGGGGNPGQYNLGPNAGPQMPAETGGILDMFNQGGGQQNYTPWEEGWGG
jgi:hypothetical protein